MTSSTQSRYDSEPATAECEAARRYHILTEALSDVVFELQVDAGTGVNLAWTAGPIADLTGYTPSEYRELGGWPAIVHSDDRDAAWEALRRASVNQPTDTTLRIVTKDGWRRWLEVRMRGADAEPGSVATVVGSLKDVTDAKESEERWRDFASLGQDVAYEIIDGDAGIPVVTWSVGLEQVTGHTLSSLEGLGGPLAIVHPDDAAGITEHLEELFTGRGTTETTARFAGPDGHYHWYRLRATPRFDPVSGEVVGARGIAIDISDLKESEERWQTLSAMTSDLVVAFRIEDGEPHPEWMAGNFVKLAGVTPEEMASIGGLRALVHPDDLGSYDEHMRRVASGKPDEIEIRIVDRAGNVKWVRMAAQVEPDNGDGARRYLGSVRDVTEARLATDRWAALAELTSDYAYEAHYTDLGAFDVVWQNQALESLTGYTMEEYEALGGWPALVLPEDRQAAEEAQSRIRHGLVDDRELRLRARDGDVTRVRTLTRPLIDERSGVVTGFLGAVRDVTAQYEAARHEKHLSAVLAGSADAIYSRDVDGHVLTWNEGAQRIYGYTAEEMLGHTIDLLELPDRRGESNDLFVRALMGHEIIDFQTAHKTGSGHQVDISLTMTPVRDGHGQVIAVATVARDITTAKETLRALETALERQRSATTRLEETNALKDRFIAAVSHELRTPLTPIIGFAATVRARDMELDHTLRAEMLDGIVRNAEELSRMVERLLETAQLSTRSAPVDVKAVDVRRAVLDMLTTSGNEFSHHQWQLDLEPVQVLANVEALRVVLRNLCSNAVKYSDKASTVSLSARVDGDEVLFEVADRGHGIGLEMLGLLFEPFQQASEQPPGHRGLGVGLFAARSYVTSMGGRIWVESSSDAGATLAFTLPRAAQTNEASTTANAETASPGTPQA